MLFEKQASRHYRLFFPVKFKGVWKNGQKIALRVLAVSWARNIGLLICFFKLKFGILSTMHAFSFFNTKFRRYLKSQKDL